MLDIRRREEAEGERRMIGSERLLLTLDCSGLEGCEGTGRVARVLEDVERELGWPLVLDDGMPLAPRRPRKSSACLRTWEKS